MAMMDFLGQLGGMFGGGGAPNMGALSSVLGSQGQGFGLGQSLPGIPGGAAAQGAAAAGGLQQPGFLGAMSQGLQGMMQNPMAMQQLQGLMGGGQQSQTPPGMMTPQQNPAQMGMGRPQGAPGMLGSQRASGYLGAGAVQPRRIVGQGRY